MKAWLAREWGEAQTMEFAEVPTPEPGPKQTLVRVEAAALNFLDTLMIRGQYQVKPPLPFTPGVEVAGTVVKAGPDSRYRPGDRLAGVMETGGYAEMALLADSAAIPLPATIDAAEGAALPVVYPTAHYALKQRAQMQPGEIVLIHAAAGGTGMAAVQIAKAWGGKVIACAGGEEKAALCRECGADLALDYADAGWTEQVKAFTQGRGADVILDPVGGDVTEQSLKCLGWGARLLIVGFASGRIASIPANRLLIKQAAALGVFWGEWSRREPEGARAIFAELFAMHARGEIKPVISRRYPLSEAAQALLDLGSRRTTGKVVLIP